MLNQHNQIICDTCNNILSDGVTLLPGYLCVENGIVTAHHSTDPNNAHDVPPLSRTNPRLDLPRNRLTGDNGENYVVSQIVTLPEKVKDGDYCAPACALQHLDK